MDTQTTILPTRKNSMYATLTGGKGRLAGMVDSLLTAAPATQLSLLEELALARATVADSIAVYEALVLNQEGQLKAQEVLLIGNRIREAIKDVAKIAKTAASIELAKSVSPSLITALAMSIESAVSELTDGALREQLLDKLQLSFHTLTTKVGNANAQEQAIVSPYELCAAMDSSVPLPEGFAPPKPNNVDEQPTASGTPTATPFNEGKPTQGEQPNALDNAFALLNAMKAASEAVRTDDERANDKPTEEPKDVVAVLREAGYEAVELMPATPVPQQVEPPAAPSVFIMEGPSFA